MQPTSHYPLGEAGYYSPPFPTALSVEWALPSSGTASKAHKIDPILHPSPPISKHHRMKSRFKCADLQLAPLESGTLPTPSLSHHPE